MTWRMGYDVEVAVLAALSDEAATRRAPRVALVTASASAPPGTLAGIARALADAGSLVLAGSCPDPTRATPFAPVTAPLARYLRTVPDATRSRLLDGLAPVVALVREPLAHDAGALATTERLGPGLAREVRFSALARLFERIVDAEAAAPVIAIDHLHRVDDDTAALLGHLLSSRTGAPVVVVASHDDGADAAGGPAAATGAGRALVGSLAAAPGVARVALAPVVVAPARAAPPAVRLALAAAAVAGPDAPRPVLAAVADALGIDGADLHPALDEARSMGLLSPQGLAPAVEADVLGGLASATLQRAHLAAARAVAAATGPGEAASGAFGRAAHLLAAGDLAEPAVLASAARAAADLAFSLSGVHCAEGAYLAAVRAARRGALGTDPEVLERLASCRLARRDVSGAAEALDDAISASLAASDLVGAARGLLDRARVAWRAGDDARAGDDSAAALAMLSQRSGAATRLALRRARLAWFGRSLGRDELEAALAEGEATVRAATSSPLRSAGSLVVTAAHLALGRFSVASGAAEAALALARSQADPWLERGSLLDVGTLALCRGDHGRAAAAGRDLIALADGAGATPLADGGLVVAALAAYLAGRWEDAATLAAGDAGDGRSRPACGPARAYVQALLAARRGDPDTAAAALALAAGLGSGERADHRSAPLLAAASGAWLLAAGRPADAVEALAGFGADPPHQRALPAIPIGVELLCESLVALGDPIAAARTARAVGGGESGLPAALAARFEGIADAERGQPVAARAKLDLAAAAFDSLSMPLAAAATRIDAVDVASFVPARERAASLLEGLHVAEAVGAVDLARRARLAARRLGVRVPAVRGGGAGGLSGRELAVARLVAAGAGLTEIAARLVLSERTVASHFDSVGRRTGTTSREGLASWLAERGLAG